MSTLDGSRHLAGDAAGLGPEPETDDLLPDEKIRSVCRMCHGGCGVIVHRRNGRITHLSGDKSNPNNTGFLCSKGVASRELVYHPERLTRPLLRVGSKNSGRFREVDWDEAFNVITDHLADCLARHGAESIVLCQGTDRNFQEWIFRFANALGTPNVLGPAHVCFYPRVMASILTMGAFTFCDYEATPKCLVVWGSNKAVTHSDGVIGVRLWKALRRGTELVVIDPRRTRLARRAKYWLQIKPGTDVALALGFLHVIIRHGLFDDDFVKRYTVGFEALRKHVERYDPDRVSKITQVPARLIEEAAFFYANASSAAIQTGAALDQNRNSFGCARAVVLLSAVCGNIDRPGGDIVWDPTGIEGRRSFPKTDILPREQSDKRLGGRTHRILAMAGWAHPAAVWRAILEHDPYPVKAMMVLGSNPLLTYADTHAVHRALKALDFLVVGDLFLTPTAHLADVVLPVASWLERDEVVEHAHYVAARRKVVQIGQCKSDEEILNTLARRLGIGDLFWESEQDACDYKLRPIGSSWRNLVSDSYLANRKVYEKFRKGGFRTRSGKLDLYSDSLRELGYEPLPVYRPIEPECTDASGYILASCHSPHYFNSEFRQLSGLRRREPEPLAELHPESAEREMINDGDSVALSVGEREVTLRARVTEDVAPGVIYASPSWWYPEADHTDNWRTSNVNCLTSPLNANEEMGSSNLRGVVCHIRRIDRQERGCE